MASVLSYTVLQLAPGAQLVQLHTTGGKLFVAGEVAQLFNTPPTAFQQELRRGQYAKTASSEPSVLAAVVQLGLQVESAASHAGVVLLPPATVEALLQDKRRADLLVPFKMASLKLASQEAARLMAAGDYEAALPVSLEAVTLGEQLFKPAPALQMFPLYLLAAQANLGLRRTAQCEHCLSLASVLQLREPDLTSNTMRSQLARLYGQLYAAQGKAAEALKAFAEDVYYCSLEHGPTDAHASLGFFNLAKVLQAQGNMPGAMSCGDAVVDIWAACLQRCRLRCLPDGAPLPPGAPIEVPVGRMQLREVVEMLQDVAALRAEVLGGSHSHVAAAHAVAALALAELGDAARAAQALETAKQLLQPRQPDAGSGGSGESDAGVREAQLRLVERVDAHLAAAAGGV